MAIVTGTALKSNKNFRVNFDGGNLSSDGGLLLLKEFYHKLGVKSLLKKHFHTTDSASFRIHKDHENLLQIHVMTPEEIARIRDVVENGYVLRWESKKGNPIKTAPQKLKQAEYFLFLLNTGLRAGEARALKYSDINFETRRMEISRNFTTTRTRDAEGNTVGGMTYVEGKPKTKSSARVLYLSLAALEYLKRLKAQEPEGYDGYIANADGKPLNDANFRRRFNSLLSQANVQHCGLHAIRHTFASYYYEYTNGNRKLVADYLGHSISNLTERVYVMTSDRFMEQSIRDFVI